MNEELYFPESKPLLVVSNRLPITIKKIKGQYTLQAAAGGLVTALAPLLRKIKGSWVGWTGGFDIPPEHVDALLEQFYQKEGFHLIPVYLEEEEVHLYYQGFSNEILWPLFHDLHSHCRFRPEYWIAYQKVNRKFCEVIEKNIQGDELVWVHDYHLMKVAEELSLPSNDVQTAFFLHTPFAPPDIFMKIPWREQLLNALLTYDHIGFQTKRDTLNFINCVQTLLKEAKIYSTHLEHAQISCRNHSTHVGTYPISIDYEEFSLGSASKEVVERALSIFHSLSDRKLVFSVDRLDMTKGIPYRLEAIRYFLKRYPKWHEKVTFIQVVVPSRTDVWNYIDLKNEIDKLVSEINAEFTTAGWIPIHYMFQCLSRKELLAYYQAASVMWITSIKDGMNLVAKEYPSSKHNTAGILILSEFAGSAFQLSKGALLVNPYDVLGMADKLEEALNMDEIEQRTRLKILQEEVQSHDIYRWIGDIFQDTSLSFQEQHLLQGEATPLP